MMTDIERRFHNVWEEAQQRFMERAGNKLNFSPPVTLNDIKRQIESSPEEHDSKRAKDKQQFKTVCFDVLSCLKLLGGVAAQGASIVFGPANLCFNAFSLLLDMPQKLSDFHALIDSILGQVSGFLGQFKIYQRIEEFHDIDVTLFDNVHQLMICFFDLCALALSLRKGSRWDRFKYSVGNVLLDKDFGIKDNLDKFRTLTEKQDAIRATLTLEAALKTNSELTQVLNEACETGKDVREIRKVVEYVASDVESRVQEKDRKDRLERIKSMLGVTDTDIEKSHRKREECWEESITNTGTWLHANHQYSEWIEGGFSGPSLLLLKGDAGTGRSTLVSVVAHELLSRSSQLNSKRTVVTSYFLQKAAEKGAKIDQTQPRPTIEKALKCMAVDIASSDANYLKHLSAICDNKDRSALKDSTLKELWCWLILDAAKRDVTFFFLIDGLEEVHESDAEEFLREFQSSCTSMGDNPGQVQVLLSGNSSIMNKNGVGVGVGPSAIIDVGKDNVSDIRAYITAELKKYDLLQGLDPLPSALRELVIKELPGKVEGSFVKAQSAIKSIDAAIDAGRDSDAIRRIVDEANQDEAKNARKVLEEISESLSIEEINELNELLIWVVYGCKWFTVEELESVLHSRTGITVLQPLEKRIERKYNRIFEFNDGWVIPRPELQDSLILGRRRRHDGGESPKISATITITKADSRSVQNFLWRLTERAVREDFEFNDLTSQSFISKPSIGVNKIDALVTIVEHSLEVVKQDTSDGRKDLLSYIWTYFPDDLERLIDCSDAMCMTEDEKSNIGEMIYSLFEDGEMLEKYIDDLESIAQNWLSGQPGPIAFWHWLQDESAIRGLRKRDKEFLRHARSQSNSDQSLLQPVTEMVARHWLTTRSSSVNGTSSWMLNFIALNSNDGNQKAKIEELTSVLNNKSDSTATSDEKTYDSTHEERYIDNEPNSDHTGLEHSVNNLENSLGNGGKGTNGAIGPNDTSGSATLRELSVIQKIEKAEEWAQNALKIEKKDALWNERLGETYLLYNEPNAAISAFQNALSLEKDNQFASAGLASAYAQCSRYEEAVHEISQTLSLLRKDSGMSNEERSNMILKGLFKLAECEDKLGHTVEAIETYNEALKLDTNDDRVSFNLLKLMLRSNQKERLKAFLSDLMPRKSSHSDTDQLVAILQYVSADESFEMLLNNLLSAMQNSTIFGKLVAQMETAAQDATQEERAKHQATFWVFIGQAKSRYVSVEPRGSRAALAFWERCLALKIAGSIATRERLYWARHESLRLICSYHFEQAISTADPSSHLQELEYIATDPRKHKGYAYLPRYYLGSYHAQYSQDGNHSTKAREVFLKDLKGALELLSDEDDWNDSEGFGKLAYVLRHYGDEMNAIYAFLAMERISESNRYFCTGGCNRESRSLAELSLCMVYYNIAFCEECTEEVKAGTYNRTTCNFRHRLLYVPRVNKEENENVGKNEMLVDGRIEDRVLLGARVITVQEWLDGIRDGILLKYHVDYRFLL